MSPATRGRPPLPGLMLVTDRGRLGERSLLAAIASAVNGGLEWIQVRERDLTPAKRSRLLGEIRRIGAGLRIVVNGDAETARKHGAGLHLAASAGEPWPAGRRPPSICYGRSVHDEAEADAACAGGVDYLIAGNVYATSSKRGRPGKGTEWLARMVARATPVPVLAIGGVTAARIPELLDAGAHGIAVCGAILLARSPAAAVEEMLRSLASRCAAGETA